MFFSALLWTKSRQYSRHLDLTRQYSKPTKTYQSSLNRHDGFRCWHQQPLRPTDTRSPLRSSQSTAESIEAFFSQLQPPRIGFRDCSFFGRFRVVSYGSSIHFKIRTLAPRHSSPAPCTGCLVHASAMTMPEWRLEVVRDTHGQLRGGRPCSGKVPGPRRGGARAALLKQNFA